MTIRIYVTCLCFCLLAACQPQDAPTQTAAAVAAQHAAATETAIAVANAALTATLHDAPPTIPSLTFTATTTQTPTRLQPSLPATRTPFPATLTRTPTPASASGGIGSVTYLVPQVISRRPHDTSAFTQGFVLHEGRLFESTGQRGESTLREVDPLTGAVLRRYDVPEIYFAEGLALVDDRLIQITWQEGTAFVYDRDTFALEGTFSYTGEGWGLCYDGTQLWMSDGSANLYARDPQTFELLRAVPVTLNGIPQTLLNELECVDGMIYANVWQFDTIVVIDPTTGMINTLIDARGLLTPEEIGSLPSGSVLNGIAYDPDNDVFLITGKNWMWMFEVRFVTPG